MSRVGPAVRLALRGLLAGGGLWLLGLTACPAPPLHPDPKPAAHPQEDKEPDLTYTFHLDRGPPPRVEVSLRFAGSPSGTTRLRVAESWANIRRPDRFIGELSVRGPDGQPLTLRHPQHHIWTIAHPADAALTARWTLSGPGRPLVFDPGDYHRPIVEAGRFQLIGTVGLLFPEHLAAQSRARAGTPDPDPQSGRRRIAVRWEGFAEAGWKVACSHSADQRGFSIEQTLHAFRQAVFLAGHLRLRRVDLSGGRLVVAIDGEWPFAAEDFVALTRRIVEAERDFFDDHDYPFYLVSLFPVGPAIPGRTATAGTGLTDSIALFVSPGLSLAPDSRPRRNLAHLLAHELFHNWNGRKIQRREPERLSYWFSEGFTEFYTRRLLYRAGLSSLSDLVQGLNAASVAYHTHPARRAPNRRIDEDFWTDENMRTLPYLRGELVATVLDARIRKQSGGRTSLDDLMRALARHTGQSGERIDTAVLLDWFARYTDGEFATSLGRVIEGGADLTLPPGVLAPCLRMEQRQIGPYELGFDLDASMAERRVRGVKKGSAAHRAGLRDGQALRGWRIEQGRADLRVELTVRDGSKRIPISYFPQRDPRPVPWFIIDDAQACPGRL